jgi:hypothetical protein
MSDSLDGGAPGAGSSDDSTVTQPEPVLPAGPDSELVDYEQRGGGASRETKQQR